MIKNDNSFVHTSRAEPGLAVVEMTTDETSSPLDDLHTE